MEKRRERTRIIVRRAPMEPKTALAGVTLEDSFARFIVLMAAFSEEKTLSGRFYRLEFAFMGFGQVIRAPSVVSVSCTAVAIE